MDQKRIPLLPATSAKPKKEPKTYCFELELGESNEQTYSSFSWLDLIHDSDAKETKEKLASGVSLLNPYASDDEDELKAMAARFEAKYSSGSSGKKEKRKRRAEDFIDKGAGYDESDSFIDNSDIYDEVVPIDLQPAHGGFYINTGALDFKQVEVSEDEDDNDTTIVQSEDEHKTKNKVKQPSSSKSGAVTNSNHAEHIIKQVSRPGKDSDPARTKPVEKRRGSNSSSGSSSNKPGPKRSKLGNASTIGSKTTTQQQGNRSEPPVLTPAVGKNVISLTSSSEESTTESSDSTSSSTSSSQSTERNTEKNNAAPVTVPKKKRANTNTERSKPAVHKTKSLPSLYPIPGVATNLNSKPSATPPAPQKRLKVKNVPLNPKLHGNVPTSTTSPSGSNNSTPRQSPLPTMAPLTVSFTQSMQSLKPQPPPLSQQISPNSIGNSDLLISKVSTKDITQQQNLLKLPTLTPAPSVIQVSPNANVPKAKPTLKKVTNRMSCGTPRMAPIVPVPSPQVQVQNVKERKSDTNSQSQSQSSFQNQVITSGNKMNMKTANSSITVTQNNLYNTMQQQQQRPSSSSSPITVSVKNQPNNAVNQTSKSNQKITVTQKTFNKIRKPRKSPAKQNATTNSGVNMMGDPRLNPKHAVTAADYLSPTSSQAQAQFLQQMMIVASANSFAYSHSRQSLINTTTSSQNVAAVIPSTKAKSVSSNEPKQKGRSSTSSSSSAASSSSVIFKGNSGMNTQMQRNSPSSSSIHPPPPPMQQFVNSVSLPSSLSLTSLNSNFMTASVAGQSQNQQQPQSQYAKHITPFDVSTLLSNRKM